MKQAINKIFGKKAEPKNVLFPITKKEFEALCSQIAVEFDLPYDDTTRDWLATAVLHAPSGVGAAPLSYFGSFVRKGISNTCCFGVTEEIKKKKIDAKKTEMKSMPQNQVETSTEETNSKPVPN